MSTHLCDTCKYREEECKPELSKFDGDTVSECDGYEEDKPCSA